MTDLKTVHSSFSLYNSLVHTSQAIASNRFCIAIINAKCFTGTINHGTLLMVNAYFKYA